MDDTIRVATELFEHRDVKPHFINPCCFGEDFAAWLKHEIAPLKDAGFEFSELIQEDYGWGFWARHGETPFWVAVGNCDASSPDTPAEWVVMVAYDPGLNLIKRLFHRPDQRAYSRLIDMVRGRLESSSGIKVLS